MALTDQTTWLMLKKLKAFRVVEIRNTGDVVGDSFTLGVRGPGNQ